MLRLDSPTWVSTKIEGTKNDAQTPWEVQRGRAEWAESYWSGEGVYVLVATEQTAGGSILVKVWTWTFPEKHGEGPLEFEKIEREGGVVGKVRGRALVPATLAEQGKKRRAIRAL